MFLIYSKGRALLRADMVRWAEVYHLDASHGPLARIMLFCTLMTFTPEFRNVFYLRNGRLAKIFSWLCPPLASLQIEPTSIGPGLFIQHGISTLVSAESIGANCWINQHVVVGYSDENGRPVIGDNVRICAGAKIVGKLTVGDNVTIGLNTVVITDVPDGSTVLGVPGKILWKRHARISSETSGEQNRFLFPSSE
jgi:serine O-acetyltransferase